MNRDELVSELNRIEMHALARNVESGADLGEIEEKIWRARRTHPDAVKICAKINKALGRTAQVSPDPIGS